MTRRRDSGYAMLLIFLMAGLVAISLYRSMPGVAFEAERDQEQLLIDRGEQYKRAIQLFYRKTGHYPSKIEELEDTNGIRFLRKKYVDPLTGKAEWRLIHVGPGGVFTDSLTQKATGTQQKKDAGSVNTFVTELKPVGGGDTGLNGPVNVGLRRRASEGGATDPNNPFPAMPVEDPQFAANNNPGFNPNANQGFDPNVNNASLPNGGHEMPVASPGIPFTPGAVSNDPNATNQFPNGFPMGRRPGSPGAPNSGPDVIRNLLTSPRPGGPPPGLGGVSTDQFGNPLTPANGAIGQQTGLGSGSAFNQNQLTGSSGSSEFGQRVIPTGQNGFGQQLGGNLGGQTVGGGIAGVASTAAGEGIKIYKEHTKYKEWEFIYDYGKDLAGRQNLPNQNANLNGNGQNPIGTGGGANPVTPQVSAPPQPGPQPFPQQPIQRPMPGFQPFPRPMPAPVQQPIPVPEPVVQPTPQPEQPENPESPEAPEATDPNQNNPGQPEPDPGEQPSPPQ